MPVKKATKTDFLYLALLIFGLSLSFNFLLINMTSIFSFLGVSGTAIPYLWLAAPVTGLLVQPIVGQLSDDTNSRYGKRRPYILGWGILTVISFFILPFLSALLLIILFIWLIGSSINGCTEGVRALTGDLTTQQNRAKAFALQAALSGLGSGLGASLPYLIDKVYNLVGAQIEIIPHQIPVNIKISFTISSIVVLVTLALMLWRVHEKSHLNHIVHKQSRTTGQKIQRLFKEFYTNTKNMPKAFRYICLVQFITFSAVFIFWLYLPLTIAQNLYGLIPGVDVSNDLANAQLLQKAALATSFYTSIYQYTSVGCAFLIFFFANYLNLRHVYSFCLVLGGISLLLISLTTEHSYFVTYDMIAFGIMWGGVIVVPSVIAIDSIPKGKMGIYLGIFNVSITLPQILLSLVIGPVYSLIFHNKAYFLMIISSLLLLVSAVLMAHNAWSKKGNEVVA